MRFFLLFLFLPLLEGNPSPPLDGCIDPLPWISQGVVGPMGHSASGWEGKEFQLNEEDYPGGFPQWYPAIASLSDGRFVAVWMDERNGDYDIYAQMLGGDGEPWGESVRVNDDWGGANQWTPGIASDGEGRWAVVWSDYREGKPEIYAQIFAGGRRGRNFKLSQGKGAERYYPDVAGWKGMFLAVWEDRRDGEPDIYGQFFDLDSLWGDNFKLNDPTPRASQRYPQVASSGDGVFFVVWRDYRKGPAHIFGQFIKESGKTCGDNFWVDDDSLGYAAWYPSVAGSEGFVVAWEEWMGEDYDVFARRYDSQGRALGKVIRVSQDPTQSEQSLPSIGADSRGFLVSWADKREGNYDIYAQRFDREGNPQGGNFRVDDDQSEADQLWPTTACGRDGFCICWRDRREGLAQVFAQGYDSIGGPEGCNFKPGGDIGGAHQLSPSLASDHQGLTLSAWEDYRWGKAKLCGQWFTRDGQLLGGNFLIQERPWPCTQLSPQVATNEKGRFSLSWMEWEEGDWDVWLKAWPGSSIRVNDQSLGFQGFPSLSYGNNGLLLVCWEDWREGYGIFCQVYDSTLSPLGSNFRIDEGTRDSYRDHPWVDGAKGFATVWRERLYDGFQWDSHIYIQILDSLAHPIRGNFRVGQEQSYQLSPQVAYGRTNEFCVVWISKEGEEKDIYAQWFDNYGLALTDPVRVNDDVFGTTQVDPTVVGHQGRYIIGWTDYREGDGDIYFQKFKAPGVREGGNFRLNLDPGGKGQGKPAFFVADTLLMACWEDSRVPGDGWDIWAKVCSWKGTGVDDEPSLSPGVSSFTLSQNYPNPFNLATAISYRLSAVSTQGSAVSLKIYNILGKEVRTLVASSQKPGEYQVIWDGKDDRGRPVASGVYVCKLEVKGKVRKTRKLVVLR